MQPYKLAEDCTGTINDTVTLVLEIKHPIKTIPSCFMLETYEETPIFIPVDITEEAVELVVRKLSGSSVLGGTESEALQGWLLKFGEDSTRLCTRMENVLDWLSNGSPPWAAYCTFMSGLLIALYKQLGVRPFVVGETWQRLFA